MPTNRLSAALLLALLPAAALPALTIELEGGAATLVPAGESWKYFKGTAAPSTPDDAWQDDAFDHSAWLEGPGGFGYDDGDDATVLSDMERTATQDGYATVYLRREFTLATLPAATLELVVDYDDGFVAYLNGEEVARSDSMPPGAPTFETTAGSHEAGTPERFPLGSAADHLVVGTNILAIEGHNAALDSSDFSLIPSLQTSSSVVRNGDTSIIESAAPLLHGTVASAAATSVLLDGAPVSYDPGTRAWNGAPNLVAGNNTVLVEARDASGAVLESATSEIVFLPPGNRASGSLPADATWSGAVLVEAPLVVPSGVVLRIAPGTQVFLREGASLEVRGQLLADGTAESPIRFTHYGDGTTWERLLFLDAEDSRLAHCRIEFSDCEGDHKDYYDDDCDDATTPPSRTYFQAIVAVACHLEIDDCLFQNLPDDSATAEGDAIAIISDDPDLPGAATASIRRCDFLGIGQGIHTRHSYVFVEECYFTGHNGDNDDIDLFGESTPPPLILNNRCINPGHDDMINPTRCSAILIGNVIAGGDDHGIVLRDKCRPILINNLIYNCAAGGIAIQNQCDALLIHNTIVDCGRGIRCFDHTGRWGPPYCLFPGSGRATLINCIIRNCPTTFTLEDSPRPEDQGSHLTVSYCNIDGGQGAASVSANSTLTWGEGNIDADPRFVDEAARDYRLQSSAGRWDVSSGTWLTDAVSSPCLDAGHDVLATYPELAPWLGIDVTGLARPLDGDADGTTAPDMGAHEVLSEHGDSNHDGIPDHWVVRHGLDPLDSALASGNPDHDPFVTGEEWIADTDPTDAASYFRVESLTPGAPFVIHFESSADRVYSLLTSADLQSWDPVPGQVDVPGAGGPDSLSDPAPDSGARTFYRIGVRVP